MPDPAGTHVTPTRRAWPPIPRAGRKPWAITREVRDAINAFIEQLPEALPRERRPPMSTTPESEATREAVRQRYAGIAREHDGGDRRSVRDELLCPKLLRE